jgi:hypothetical protein
MATKPLDELYFEWLYGQVGQVGGKDPSAGYWKLFKLLYDKEFVWTLLNDDNRAEDGRALRVEFLTEEHYQIEPLFFDYPCSVLELLIALSRRLSFEGDGDPRSWFWEMINNLGLYNYRDGGQVPERRINAILDDFVWRSYQADGRGGLFPLKHPEEDQRDVEIWYQMCAYLLERE